MTHPPIVELVLLNVLARQERRRLPADQDGEGGHGGGGEGGGRPGHLHLRLSGGRQMINCLLDQLLIYFLNQLIITLANHPYAYNTF